jgi:transposase
MPSVYHAAGVDVCKQHLDLAFAGQPPRRTRRLNNDDTGCRQIVAECRKHRVDCVAVESTGGYERRLITALHKAGVGVAVIQPSLVRHHARSKRVLAKNDAIDATMIADYAQQNRPRLTPPPDENRCRIRAFSDRRDQLVEDRVREHNRLEACACKAIATQLRASIRRLDKQIQQLEAQIQAMIQADEQLAQQCQTLKGIQGVGEVCATVLTAYLPELGRANRQQIAALVGLAPYDNDSGPKRGLRRVYAGRARVRRALYMAALTATRCNPRIRATYQHLLAAGKLKKVALCACARKLLVHLNSLLATHQQAQQPFRGKPAGA